MANKKQRIELGLIKNWPDDSRDVIFWRVIRNPQKIKEGRKIFANRWDQWQGEVFIHGKLITVYGWCQEGSYPTDWHDYTE